MKMEAFGTGMGVSSASVDDLNILADSIEQLYMADRVVRPTARLLCSNMCNGVMVERRELKKHGV